MKQTDWSLDKYLLNTYAKIQQKPDIYRQDIEVLSEISEIKLDKAFSILDLFRFLYFNPNTN